ncbi:type I restriction endonuclease [Flavobacterium sp. XS1P32]|uniref:type I restriction endonuclease n=1 Tax=Flavobacterium sp. XS1P32 TaxID=3401726 RepID=UPI003AB0093D
MEKFYTAEARKKAELDSNLKNSIERLNHLDTTSDDYSNILDEEIERIVKVIPQQNKVELTHYVARRKLVLELFSLILNSKLSVQNDGSRNNDEALLHNLIFQQNTTSPDKSDLWIINEDFIYFQGISESKLSEIKFKGENIIREDLSEEENKFITSIGENRLHKRPDILLFPQEEKCIIIEFKNPSVSVSDHLNQINNYATLLRNFSIPEMKLTTFYGYLIGEKIEPNDVRAYDADFKNAYNFDYLFRPSKTIAGMFNNEGKDGSLYTEVVKYSTLLERAKNRNNIFIKKLTKENID